MCKTNTPLQNLLGSTLQASKGTVNTDDALAGKKAIALYFSAHWCPPCRQFTPKLAEWYTKDLKAQGLEIVFVSSDRDEDSFKEYFAEQPWLALPYEARGLKDSLSKKYKVNGIPAVVIIDAEGNIITKDGRAALTKDPKGEQIPWTPKTFDQICDGAMVMNKEGQEVSLAEAISGKTVAYYFSAHWCPPCRQFTPKLAEWYTKDLKAKGLEVVFCSSDHDEDAFKEYYADQPWLALTFSDRDRKTELSEFFGVSGIPALVLVDSEGAIITKEARGAVSADPTGIDYPWYPKPVKNLKAGPGDINEVPMIIALCETSDEAVQKEIEASMTPIAERLIAEAKVANEEDPKMTFMMVTEVDELAGQLRGMFKLPSSEEKQLPKLMIMDIPDEGGYYEGPEAKGLGFTVEEIQSLYDDYAAKKLDRKQLS